MKIGIYMTSNNAEHNSALVHMQEGISKVMGKDSVVRERLDEFTKGSELYDVAVIFGVYKKCVEYSKLRGDVMKAHKAAGKRIMVIEKGYIKRDDYYAVGWDWFNGGADFNNEQMPSDRWDALGVKSKFTLGEFGPKGDAILLCGQVPWDASVQDTNHLEWLCNVVNAFKSVTDKPIIFRPHPLALEHTPHILGTSRSVLPLEIDLSRTYGAVMYNSNTCVDALLAGVPVWALGENSMVDDTVANMKLISDLKPKIPDPVDGMQWAYNIAYTQWTFEEMAQGLPWEHLTRNLKEEAA